MAISIEFSPASVQFFFIYIIIVVAIVPTI